MAVMLSFLQNLAFDFMLVTQGQSPLSRAVINADLTDERKQLQILQLSVNGCVLTKTILTR